MTKKKKGFKPGIFLNGKKIGKLTESELAKLYYELHQHCIVHGGTIGIHFKKKKHAKTFFKYAKKKSKNIPGCKKPCRGSN